MGKNIIYPYITFNQFVDEPILKKLALFFENIYIANGRLSIISGINSASLKEEFHSLLYEKATIDYLCDQNIVKIYSFPNVDKDLNESIEAKLLEEQMFQLMKNISQHKDESSKTTENSNSSKAERMNSFYGSHDICVRFDALRLQKDKLSEFYPLLRTNSTIIQKEKKSEVIQFLLNDIPEPNSDIPWEQIVDYRADEELKNKYLALINWINKIASGTASLSDIKDEYEYLYSEYMKNFKLHKMKYNNNILEVIVKTSTDVLKGLHSGDIISTVKNMFQLKSSQANLLSEEGKLLGKEVAYIYHTKAKFK